MREKLLVHKGGLKSISIGWKSAVMFLYYTKLIFLLTVNLK